MGKEPAVEAVVGRGHTSAMSYATIALAGLGGFIYGYAANILTGTLAQPTFLAKFLSTPDAIERTNGMVGGFFGGALIGVIVQAPIANRFGRRAANGVAALLLIFASALSAGSTNVAMFLAGRTISGFGAAMCFANTPTYTAELATPHNRGMLVGSQGLCVVGSYIVSALLGFAFYFVDADYAWRLNYIVLTGFSCIFLGSLFALPESPRWLMERGREDEARGILERLHRNPANPADSTLAKAEFVQIRAQIAAERSLPSSYWYILTTPSMLKRAVCTLLVWTMGQSTGITVIANLIATLMGNLGFGTVAQLGLGVAWDACVLLGCFANVLLMDRLGRVKLLVIGGFGCSVLLVVEGVLQKYYLATTDAPGLNAAVAMYFIFGVWFTSTIECTGYVYGAEIWPTHLRSKGATLNYVGFFGPALAYTYPATTAFATIGWEYYMVFVAITVPCCVAIYFLLPETTGLTLEEIGPLFGDDVQVKFEDALHADLGESTRTQSVEVSGDEKAAAQ
ncbi:hypothetical protein SLS58_002154 [Diplodia intermedia]|uniref:Major facilitator superfamily (MFS) profile domain-containing protein n=1 Tax=Diplodia intermedia TaxID=856260 RepID=A0ABR3TZR8_9PEZI